MSLYVNALVHHSVQISQNLFQSDKQGFCVWKRIICKEDFMRKSQSITLYVKEKNIRPNYSVWFENEQSATNIQRHTNEQLNKYKKY